MNFSFLLEPQCWHRHLSHLWPCSASKTESLIHFRMTINCSEAFLKVEQKKFELQDTSGVARPAENCDLITFSLVATHHENKLSKTFQFSMMSQEVRWEKTLFEMGKWKLVFHSFHDFPSLELRKEESGGGLGKFNYQFDSWFTFDFTWGSLKGKKLATWCWRIIKSSPAFHTFWVVLSKVKTIPRCTIRKDRQRALLLVFLSTSLCSFNSLFSPSHIPLIYRKPSNFMFRRKRCLLCTRNKHKSNENGYK